MIHSNKKIDYNLCMLKLRELREASKITQQELAQELHISRYSITNWELGRAFPDSDNLIRLAEFFDVSIDYLVGYVDEFGNKVI